MHFLSIDICFFTTTTTFITTSFTPLALKLINKYKKTQNHPQCVETRKSKSQRKIYTMQKALFEPGTPVFIYRLFQFATVGLLILLIVLYTQGKFIFIIHCLSSNKSNNYNNELIN